MTVVNPKSISGINSITTGSGSDNLLTIHTSDASSTERVRINSSGDVIVGSGITVSPDGDIFATGVTTSTTFVGALTGNVTGNISGGTVAGSTGTFSGAVSGTTGTFTGNVAVSGANITVQDSGGTSDDRITLGAGPDMQLYHNGTDSVLTNATGDLYINNNGGASDDIIIKASDDIYLQPQDGESGVSIIGDGAVELYHNNSKKLDTDSEGISVTGTVKINNTSSVGDYNGGADDMLIGTHSGNHGITILSGTSNGGYIMFSDNNGGGVNAYRGQIEYGHTDDMMRFITDSGERVRITSNGNLLVNSTTSAGTGYKLESYSGGAYNIMAKSTNGNGGYHNFTGQASNGTITSYISHNGRGYFEDGVQFDSSGESLDSYEEGTFSPGFSGDSGSGSYGYSKQVGTYTKIGNTVHFQIYLLTNAVNANASGNTLITGLPFTSISGDGGYTGVSIGYYSGWNGVTPSQALVDTNNTRMYIYKNNGTSSATYSYPGDIVSNSSIIIAGHYFTS